MLAAHACAHERAYPPQSAHFHLAVVGCLQRPRSLPPARALPRTRCRACRPGRAHAHLRPLRAADGAPQPFLTPARLFPDRCVLGQPPSFDEFQARPSVDFLVRKEAAVTQTHARVIVLAFDVGGEFGLGDRWRRGGLSNASAVLCGPPANCSFPGPCSTIWLEMADCGVLAMADVRLNASASQFTTTQASLWFAAEVLWGI